MGMKLPAEMERKVLEMAGLAELPVEPPLPEDIDEGGFQIRVRSFAEDHGWTVYHVLNSRGSLAGFPDLHLFRGPKYIVAELKTAKGKVTPAQKVFLNRYRKAGIEAFVWRPESWATIKEVLQ